MSGRHIAELYARMYDDASRVDLTRDDEEHPRTLFSLVYWAGDGSVYLFRQLWSDQSSPLPTCAMELASPERIFEDTEGHIVLRVLAGQQASEYITRGNAYPPRVHYRAASEGAGIERAPFHVIAGIP